MSPSRPPMTDLRAVLIDELVFYCGSDAPKALNAVLDTLADRADEWVVEAGGDPENGIDRRATKSLIAVLREGDEQ